MTTSVASEKKHFGILMKMPKELNSETHYCFEAPLKRNFTTFVTDL